MHQKHRRSRLRRPGGVVIQTGISSPSHAVMRVKSIPELAWRLVRPAPDQGRRVGLGATSAGDAIDTARQQAVGLLLQGIEPRIEPLGGFGIHFLPHTRGRLTVDCGEQLAIEVKAGR